MRSYRQDCGVALALDHLGERWTLLVLRELCAGPQRFSALQQALPGMGANLLSARLSALQSAGLLVHSCNVYRLSPRGQMVRPVLRQLLLLGLALDLRGVAMDAPASARVTMAVAFDPVAARGQSLVVAVTVDKEAFACLVRDGELVTQPGPCPVAPDVIMEADRPAFRQALMGRAGGGLHLRGAAASLQVFRRLFRLPVGSLEGLGVLPD